jgi:zinc protease
VPSFSDNSADTQVLFHRGDPDQAAAVVAWPSGGGVTYLRESRQLEILTQLFSNRLLEAMRERSGASYAPQVISNWPVDVDTGGTILALAQIRPEDVPAFFEEADAIARDLAANPPSEDELNRVTEPLRQLIERALSSQQFWLYNLEGASSDPRRVDLMRGLVTDYSQTTPGIMQALAQRYLVSHPGLKVAVIPEGQELAVRNTKAGESLGG